VYRRDFLQSFLAVGAIGACSAGSSVGERPRATRVIVYKDARKMYLLNRNRVLKSYDVDLGFAPEGHKRAEGDGRTPEGHYIIDRRNPNSEFHLSLGISYPDPRDVARARAVGADPGSDIFIHGDPKGARALHGPDWTNGCIAVTNDEIEEIYAMVGNGTPISIYSSGLVSPLSDAAIISVHQILPFSS